MTAIRVLLVDDQPMIRTGFRLILEAEPDIAVVGEAGDGENGVESTRTLQPDVVLMDIRMPRMDGVEATRRIVESGMPSRVIILTTFDLDQHVHDALRAGASGFLVKDGPADSLVGAIRTVAEGDAVISLVSRADCSTVSPASPPPNPIPCHGASTPSPRASSTCSARSHEVCPTRRSRRNSRSAKPR